MAASNVPALFVFYGNLAAFAWLSAMGFDVWLNVRRVSNRQTSPFQRGARFIFFYLYGYGVTACVFVIGCVVEFAPGIPSDTIKLGLDLNKQCWFGGCEPGYRGAVARPTPAPTPAPPCIRPWLPPISCRDDDDESSVDRASRLRQHGSCAAVPLSAERDPFRFLVLLAFLRFKLCARLHLLVDMIVAIALIAVSLSRSRCQALTMPAAWQQVMPLQWEEDEPVGEYGGTTPSGDEGYSDYSGGYDDYERSEGNAMDGERVDSQPVGNEDTAHLAHGLGLSGGDVPLTDSAQQQAKPANRENRSERRERRQTHLSIGGGRNSNRNTRRYSRPRTTIIWD
ncbi:unnamed protein product [Darwinula stevensoni]|uniref:Uncharacterized protein n=1 Tax=Darwinula stevensoni TaxID=69355 RepID=A0A7R9AGI0_9CRUS|nr:unnamed protein product [Darwinula stevensoni]CAG0903437.1 unnamed protein product [Darwinula stevensoni]